MWLAVTGAGTISLGRWLVGKRRGATQPGGSETTMHVRTLLAAFNIAPDEGVPVALLLSHSFFMGLAGVFFYTAASAIFLMTFAPTALPFVYMASAGFVALCGFLYAQARGTPAGVTALPRDTGGVGALCRGLSRWPLAHPCPVARLRSVLVAPRPGGLNEPGFLGPGRAPLQRAAREAAVQPHRDWRNSGKYSRRLCHPSGGPRPWDA